MKKVALIVGHSKRDGGAINKKFGVNEFKWNSAVVKQLADILAGEPEFEPVVIYRDNYTSLPDKVNQTEPDIAIEFHCNAFDTNTSGSETVYLRSSLESKKLAEHFQSKMVQCLKLLDRGTRGILPTGRGGYLLQNTKMPCILVEPFFIDHDSDLLRATDKQRDLAQAYADAIKEYYGLVISNY